MTFSQKLKKNVLENVPNLKTRKDYSISFYTGGVDVSDWKDLSPIEKEKALAKEWYIRWSYRNPETLKMVPQPHIKAGVNRYHSMADRMEFMNSYKRGMIETFKDGMNPFTFIESSNDTPTNEAIRNAMVIKQMHMAPKSFIRYKSDIGKFTKYLKKNGLDRQPISSITKNTIVGYLNDSLKHVGIRSRNNYRTNIGSLWQCMEDNGVIERNFVKTIPMLRNRPKRNTSWTNQQAKDLFDYMAGTSPNLLLFIKFVSYNFLRPIEVCRLRRESFNFDERTLTVRTKGEESKTKTIPDILLRDIPRENMNGHLFTKNGLWGTWDIDDESKRGHFSGEFRKVKEVFGFDKNYGIYSFRSYYISKLYREFRKKYSPFETKSKLMLITGHTTMAALEKYLRSIDAELSEDYSDMLR